jgi:hypothetical protein
MPMDSETGMFELCETSSEVFLLVFREDGLPGVEALLDKSADTTRESLRRDADTLQRVGLADLAALLRQRAKKAKRAPMNFKKRWPR